MALVTPRIARFAVVQSFNGQDVINILDVDINTTSSVTSREEACFAVCGDILNNWNDHILPAQVNGLQAIEVRWVDLNSLDGSTGARSSTSAETWPANGGLTGAPLPNNVTIRIRKNLQGSTRVTRRGEVRLAGGEEAYTGPDGITLTPATVSGLNDRWEDFKDGINGTRVVEGYEVNLAQVHTVNEEAVGHSIISTFEVVPVVGTQRRRMPGYGT